jgi:hypothetical protein
LARGLEARSDASHAAFPTEGGSRSSGEGDHWLPGFGLPTLDETPFTAIEYHGELVVAGIVRMAGSQPVRGIARWTVGGWMPLGSGVDPAYALAVFGDRLIAAPWYGQVSAWDGSSWSPLPPAPIMNINALEVREGLLYAAGFTPDGRGGEWGRVASFDGVGWRVLGSDFDQPVQAIGFFRGMLVAGGSFRHNDATEVGYVAAWNGTNWIPMDQGIDAAQNGSVRAVQDYGDRLIVGGRFQSSAGQRTPGLAAWDGASWSPLAGAPDADVGDMLVADGKLYLAGNFGGETSSVATWDGSILRGTDDPLGYGYDVVHGLARFGGAIAAVGGFTSAGQNENARRVIGVAVMGPEGWHGLEHWDSSMHGLAHRWGAAEVHSAVVYRGDLIVGGDFEFAGEPPGWKDLHGLARWDGATWQSLAEGSGGQMTMAVFGENLIAAGYGVARWDGAQWHPMGQGLAGLIFALAEYQGRIYAGGEFRIGATNQPTTLAAWNGTEWSAVPGAPNSAEYNTPRVSALEVADGVLYVGGNFLGAANLASPSVVAWNGLVWKAVGTGMRGEVRALKEYRGDLYAGGFISSESGWSFEGLRRWDGTSWHSMGVENGGVQCLATFGNRLLVGGFQGVDHFVPGALGLVAWDGRDWSGFGAFAGTPYAMCQLGSDLIVGGRLNRAGDQAAFGLARWSGGEPPASNPSPSANFYVRSTMAADVASFSYSLPEAGRARVDVFDVRGRRIGTVLDREMPMGEGTLEWSPESPPAAGVYFVRIVQHGRAATARVVFLR